jgi:hypothetical protein
MADSGASLEGALPLLDTQLDEPGMRDHVNQQLLAEMEAMAAEGAADEASFLARLPPLPPAPASPLLAAELSRVARGERPAPLPTAHYALPPVPAGAAAEDPAAWEAAARGARLALEAQSLHALNLELASRYGGDCWRAAVAHASALVASARRDAASLAAAAAAANAARAAAQEDAGARLGALAKRARQCDETILQLGVGLGAPP